LYQKKTVYSILYSPKQIFCMHQSNGLGFVDPRGVAEQLPLFEGEQVADFGCGAGYFSCAFAQKVGTTGRVTALDILPASLEAVTSRARSMNLNNIVTKRANLEREGGSGFDPHSLDWVIVKDMLFQNAEKDVILYEAARVLKPSGKLFVMEWSRENTFVGPEKNLRIMREDLLALLAAAGFTITEELSVGEYHFGYLATKKQT
jgi:ubiquinone/menaquinone biosynthesis C-methylase UbiE